MTLPGQGARPSAGGPGPAERGPSNLTLRVASAVVLVPIVVGLAYVGGWPFLVLWLLGAATILCEWTRLVTGSFDIRIVAPGLGALAAAATVIGLKGGVAGPAATAAIVLGAVIAAVASAITARRSSSRNRTAWAAGGVVYAGIVLLGPLLLRGDRAPGFAAFLFVAVTVWANDTFAYAAGRTIGGPLLWPRVSPKKTWAGVAGGLVGGVVAGTLVAYASGMVRLLPLSVVAFVLSALAQVGDLFESMMKRHFCVKDVSGLIPGHGGLMDRLDGFMVAALAALLIGILRQGTDAPAQGLLLW